MKLTLANQITIIRIVLIIPFVLCMVDADNPQYGTLARYGALSIFMVMAVSDAIDGYLARRKKQITRLGSFLDPLADKLLIICACILLASGRTSVEGYKLPLEPVILILGKDVIVLLGFIIVYFLTGHFHIVPVWAGKLATFLQLVMVASILIAPEMARLTFLWDWWVHISWWSAAGIAVLAAIVYIRNGLRYIEEFEYESRQKNTNTKEQNKK